MLENPATKQNFENWLHMVRCVGIITETLVSVFCSFQTVFHKPRSNTSWMSAAWQKWSVKKKIDCQQPDKLDKLIGGYKKTHFSFQDFHWNIDLVDIILFSIIALCTNIDLWEKKIIILFKTTFALVSNHFVSWSCCWALVPVFFFLWLHCNSPQHF